MIPVKIICACGQKYAFDVEPVGVKMLVPVFCPSCAREGTRDAEQFIAKILNAKTQPLPPPAVNTLLNSVALAPHFAQALKDAVVQELAAQRRELLAAQHAAAAALYENLLTIQNAAGLEWPAADPANAGVRGEFLLGIFPPDHGGNHAPPPAPPTAPTK
jgi:hypothetical protein